MSNTLALAGAQPAKPTRFAPIYTSRFFTGLYTQRSPLRSAGSWYEERYFGSRSDALIDGSNVEISNRLTLIRRYGQTVYNSQTFSAIDFFYELRLFSTSIEQIKVIADTATNVYDATGPSTKTNLWTKSAGAGQTYFQSVGNVLYFGNGVDQKKIFFSLLTWMANTVFSPFFETFLIDTNGNIEQLTATIVPITNVAVNGSNVLTITSTGNITGIVAPGEQVEFSGVTTATFLNGQTVTISTVVGSTFTADFMHAAYGPASDTGIATVLSGGNAKTGGSQPTWNVTVGGVTNDGFAQWTNRGLPTMNWGIATVPTQITVLPTGNTTSWQANTFFSNSGVIVDSNGNLQQITSGGKSGSVNPTWSVILGGTTLDGTVTWTLIETVADLTWTAHTAYPAGQILEATPSGGVPSLFKLINNNSNLNLTGGTVTVKTFPFSSTGANNLYWSGSVGVPNKWIGGITYVPAGAPTATFTPSSLLFNPPQFTGTPDPVVSMHFASLNGAGEITGYTDMSENNNWEMVVYGSFDVPNAGNFTINVAHDDGMFFAISGATLVSGGFTDGSGFTAAHIQTPWNGYTFSGPTPVAGNNNSGNRTENFVVNFPAAGSYNFEFAYAQFKDNQQMVVTVNGQNIVPGTTTSGTVQPTWPVFSTAFAPKYATVVESSGNYTWANIGPATDYVWHALTNFPNGNYSPESTAFFQIIDQNANIEGPFRAGVSGASAPTWKLLLNQLTNDNPNLIWINQGPAPVAPAGTLSTFNGGWSYTIALVNSLNNTVSNAGPVSAYTGNFLASPGVQIAPGDGLPNPIDPQVDYVAIFRTKDGGANWYLIPGTGNTIWTVSLADYQTSGYFDTTPDSGLNILLQAALLGENTAPAQGAINLTYHLNRIFFSIGNVVYWTSGPDTPVGNGVEGVAPANKATFPSLVKRIVPTSIGALIFTVSDIYLISGQGTANSPLFPSPYADGIGLLSYNALSVNGTLIYFFTADGQLLSLDPSAGVAQIGFQLGDQLESNNWSPSTAYVTWHVSGSRDQAVYIADGSTGYFRMTPTASPEAGLTWSPFATITNGCKAVQSIEVLPGVHRLLFGPFTSGPILQRDLSVNSDNGTPYPAFGTVGSLVMAQPGQLAELAFITTDAKAVGSSPILSILMDEIAGTFTSMGRSVADPPFLSPSLSVFGERFYFSQTQEPAVCRHLQLKVSWPAEDQPNELFSFTIFGAFLQEF